MHRRRTSTWRLLESVANTRDYKVMKTDSMR